MPQINFILDGEENEIVNYFSNEWNLSKPDTIKKIIKKFGTSAQEVQEIPL